MVKLNIDPEFRDKIPALTDAEYEQLRENILSDGEVYEPIVTWNNTIVDGHNRWKIICENWELLKDKFRTKPMAFADKWEAFEWMYKKQLGRRNLTDEQRTMVIGKLYEARKKTIGGNRGNQHTKLPGVQNGPLPKTAEIIADELGIGQNTVKRAEKFAKGVDALRKQSPDAADKVLRGGSGATKLLISELPTKSKEEISEIAQDIVSGEIKKRVRASDNQHGWTRADRQERSETEAIVADMLDPSSVPEFTVEMLLEDIELNAKAYVDMLRNTLTDRSTLLTKENKPLVAAAIEKHILSEVRKLKELIEK